MMNERLISLGGLSTPKVIAVTVMQPTKQPFTQQRPPHRLLTSVMVLPILLLLTCLVTSLAHADIAGGINWLASQAQSDGAYSSPTGIATPVQATSETLHTFSLLGENAQPGISAAHQFLAAEPFHNTEYLARKIISGHKAGDDVSSLMTELLVHQNTDGGFGDLAGYQSTVLDTHYALAALAAVGFADLNVTGPAVGFLLDSQQADGGWSDNDNTTSVALSAQAMHALWHYRQVFNVTTALDSAQAFLLAQRTANVWSETFETALALIAILPRLNDTSPVADSLTALTNEQQTDGSWQGDVYTTALALRALTLADQSVPNPDLTTLTGQVIDGDTGLALSGVSVDLGGLTNASTVTSSDGGFQFSGLVDGHHTLTLSLLDYGTLTATTVLPIGGTVDLGELNLLRVTDNPTTGTIRGVVIDVQTQLPLADVAVSDGVQSTLTAEDGRYQLSNVTPGSITITASLGGYANASGNATLLAGGVLVFSPSLTPSVDPEADAALFGLITDATTQLPLSGVTVTVSGDTLASTQTDVMGAYRIEPLTPGSLTVTVSLAGYDTVVANTTVFDHNQIAFSPALYPTATTPPGANSSRISGTVVDSTTNQPLAGVSVEATFDATTVVLSTDAQGQFAVEEITADELGLRFTLTGYNSSEFGIPIDLLTDQDIGQIRLRPEEVLALQPDLVVASINTLAVTNDPATLALSGVVEAVIENVGTSDAAAVDVIAFEDVDGNGLFDSGVDQTLGSAAVSTSLAVGDQTTVSITVAGTTAFRDAPISVWVDSGLTLVELNENNNMVTSALQCRLLPTPIEEFNPVLKWSWEGSTTLPEYDQVMTVPLVGQTTDDNADGVIDTQDIPDVIVTTYNRRAGGGGSWGVLRILSGDDGRELFTSSENLLLEGYQERVIGDIDNDGIIEIIVPNYGYGNGISAFEHDGTLKWTQNTSAWTTAKTIALADLQGDGQVEIIAGDFVLDSNGNELWRMSPYTGSNLRSFRLGLVSIADINVDGHLEIVAGGAAYDYLGNVLWINSSVGDGFTAIADFTDSGDPEIVVVHHGFVSLLNHTGDLIWGPVAIPGGGEGGTPTVADMNGDNRPDIGVAGARNYAVFQHDGTLLWSSQTQDFSSRITGSTVFDFNGDGIAEVLYADEKKFRIYRGTDGLVLSEIELSSGTATEYPVVVDVDNDGHAEIVVATDQLLQILRREPGPGTTGIRVYEAANDDWMPTRRIWNQHSYHITNVNDDGTIPQFEQPSWLSHNTYRLNTFVDRDPLDSADLTVSLLTLVDNGSGQPLSLSARIGNAGLLTPSQPIPVTFYQGDPTAGGIALGTVQVTNLTAGSYQDIQLDGVTLTGSADLHAVVDPADLLSECDETNNSMSITVASASSLGEINVTTDSTSYGPNSPVALTAMVTNPGALSARYDVTLQIEDGQGVVVASFTPQIVTDLGAGSNVNLSNTWDTGTTLSGDYVLHGFLYDPNGQRLDDDIAPFTITAGETPAASLTTTTTDRPLYHTSDTVDIAHTVQNLTTNVLITAAVLNVQVTDPLGQTVFTDSVALGDLAPQALRQTTTPYSFQANPEGVYTVTAELLDGSGTLLASDQTTYTVAEDLSLSLTGTVSVQTPVLLAGESQVCTDTVNNLGTLTLIQQPLRQLVVRVDDEQLIDSADQSVDLASGGSQTLVRNVTTSGLSAGDYACVLQAEIDNAWQTLDAAVFTVEVPPIQLDSTLDIGTRGRVLVLVDDNNTAEGQGCSGVARIGLAHTFDPPLSIDATVTVDVLDDQVVLVDSEHSDLATFSSPVNAQNGSDGDLSLWDFSVERLFFTLEENNPNPNQSVIGSAYQFQAQIDDQGSTQLLDSGLIDTTCVDSLSVGGVQGDFVIDDLALPGGRDPHGTNAVLSVTAQRQYVETLLTEAGWSYTLVTDADSFTREFRSGGYTTYLLLSEQVKLAEQVQDELREAVYRGEGLVVAGDHDQRNGRLDTPLGITYRGKEPDAVSVSVDDSVVHNGGFVANLVLGDKVSKADLSGAMAVGQFTLGDASTAPAVATHSYGQGRTVYGGFDLLAEATSVGQQSALAELILGLLDYVHPVPTTLTNAVVPITLTITNQGIATAGQAVIMLPAETSLVDSSDTLTSDAVVANTWRFTFDLVETEQVNLTLWLQLPESAQTLNVEVLLKTGSDPNFTDYDTLSLLLDVQPGAVLADVLADLTLLESQDNDYRQALQALERAETALLNADDAKALKELLKTADQLIAVGTQEAEQVRVQVAQLIRQTAPAVQ